MRIFITGSNGFLAQKFCELVLLKKLPYVLFGVSKSVNRNVYLEAVDFQQFDLTNFVTLKESIDIFKPTHILHTAAVTSVEGCEEDREKAYSTNVLLTEYLARYCVDENIHFTFLSTDFVFDGLHGPYSEDFPVSPVNYYGETKVMAERSILNINTNAAILRTILVYGAIPDSSRSNLVLWAKSQLEQEKPIKVVSDQWRMPTWVDDLAEACLLAMSKKAKGIYHISGDRMMTIEEAVFTIVDFFGFNQALISSISAKEIGQDKSRPRKTGFVLDKSKNELGYQSTAFIKSLEYICKQLKKYGK